MKFPESWLREHVVVDADSDRLVKALTDIGLEVEASEPVGGLLPGVLVARIVECVPHPEADRLRLCKVDAGQPELVQIVCGAPNARAGLVAPLATVGAELPGGMKIKPAKLRGVESFGMLCSAKELAIDADASGLMELPDDAPVGASLATYLGLPDLSIEIKLTPNRADCFSVRGIAYDVAAALQASVKPMDVPAVPAQVDVVTPVSSSDAAACPRYLGRHVRGVDARAATPLWMSERLKRSGVRPVSFLVDVTQYVMLEIGQPMHAFDADLIKGEIGVRWSRGDESLKLLDQREVSLDDGFLLITDQDRPVALAGVMGGWDTRVTDDTVNVFLEAAHFAPDAIVGRARKLGMHTDASHRFERGVDPASPALAIERATQLILQIAGGTPGPVCVAEHAERLLTPSAVPLRAARIRRVLGLDVAAAEVERMLSALGMTVSRVEGGWSVVPPSRRFDIAIEEDLIEEVARILGYEALPVSTPTGAVPPSSLPETQIPMFAMRQQMAARDYFEAINFAFLDSSILKAWSMEADAIPLANPLSSELGMMRPALLPGLVEALRRNLDRQQHRVRLFECGHVFAPGTEAPMETLRIAAAACGDARAEQWSERSRAVDFFDAKGDFESLAALAGQQAQPQHYAPPVGGISLEQAADKVRRQTGGRVLSASPEEKGGRRGYSVRVLVDGKRVQQYYVDADGRVSSR